MSRRQLAENAKVLMIGTGGIGCELLKCLALTGFRNIDIVDMDTIEVSNLNRQFLFRREHVGKSKVEVAQETMKQHFPDINITIHLSNIISEEFTSSWFQQFTVVMNALDNVAARAHVNRMCLAAEVPLIDSGTAGFYGQVEVIIKNMSKCYECEPKSSTKSYPSCTIRNTPTEPIHCVVWAKNLFGQLFGEDDDENNVSPDTADPELSGSSATRALEDVNDETGIIERLSTKKWAKDGGYNPVKLFHKFFNEDILYLLSLEDLWHNRRPPVPLKWEDVIKDHDVAECKDEILMEDQKIWSMAQCVEKFETACKSLKERMYQLAKLDDKAVLTWDKDDDGSVDFVTACANFRARIFNIERKSRYDVKSMAGNIIPAIATSNAIVAGLVVFQAMHILRKTPEKCRTVYLRKLMNHRGVFIATERFMTKPNPNCLICSVSPEVTLYVDLKNMTLEELREEVFIKHFKMVEPEVTIASSGSIIISGCEDELDERFYSNKLCMVHINEDTVLKADDFFQSCSFSVIIKNLCNFNFTREDDQKQYIVQINKSIDEGKKADKLITAEGSFSENISQNNHGDDELNGGGDICDLTEVPSASSANNNAASSANNNKSEDGEDDDIVYVGSAECRMGNVVYSNEQNNDDNSGSRGSKRPLDDGDSLDKRRRIS